MTAKNDNTENPVSEVTPEEAQMFEMFKQLMAMSQRSAPKHHQATEEEWKDMVKDDHVITEEKQMKALNKSKKLQMDLQDLLGSAKGQRVLEGTIIGLRSINADKSIATWVAEVQYGYSTCTVLIPSYELFHYDIDKFRDAGKEKKIHDQIMDMLGANIKFVVRHVDEKPANSKVPVAYASRLEANQIISKQNYIRKTRTGKPRINVGDVIEAQVIAVKTHSITVSAFGLDANIPATGENNLLSWDYIIDCHTEYAVNDMITVKIQALKEIDTTKYNDKFHLVIGRLSHKDTIQNPMDAYFDTVTVEEIGLAEIYAIRDANVYCKYKNHVTVLCKYPSRGLAPCIGQKRPIRITLKKDEPGEGKRIFGVFISN